MLLAHMREGFIRSYQRSFSSSGALAPGESAVFGGMRGYSVWWPSVPSTLECNDVLCGGFGCCSSVQNSRDKHSGWVYEIIASICFMDASYVSLD